MRNIFGEYSQTTGSLQKRAGEVFAKSLPEHEKLKLYTRIPGFLDLTSLEGSDTGDKVVQLCRLAEFSRLDSEFPDAAAVCLYPSLVKYARKELQGSGILISAAAGGFPSGQTSLYIKLEEIKYAIGEGADEIDTVMNRGKLLEGLETEVFDEISAVREICGDVRLKVILETGELPSVALVRKASRIAITAGADFIKTSTGKIATGATPEAFLVMLDTIREYLEKTGKAIGIKPAGGIRTAEQALLYCRLVQEVLGEQWLHKDYFRIGASKLPDGIIRNVSNNNKI